mmetsp:Transcript_34762/g.86728  ORF Transcript_34762/g.86728 Transcript_34762/m.86728 type:complete len:669 (-) Transcript_34762:100-2106(-)
MAKPLPEWLKEARDEISATPEWQQLSDELLKAVRGTLSAQGVTSFARLEAAEQRAIVRSAADTVRGSARFRLFSTTAWRLLDLHVDAEANERVGHLSHVPGRGLGAGDVSTQVRSVDSHGTRTKASSIETLAAEGCTSLLSRLSLEELGGSCLGYLVGSQLPPPLRRAVWRRLLQQPAVANDYRSRCVNGRLAVLSSRDGHVLHEARSMLAEALTATEAADAERASFPPPETSWQTAQPAGAWAAAMLEQGHEGAGADDGGPLSLLARVKCALSYHDMLRPIGEKHAYFWIVPLAVAFAPQDAADAARERSHDTAALIPLGEADEDLALLVELYAALLKQPRPAILPEPDATSARRPADSIFAEEFDSCLESADPKLFAHLAAVLNGQPPPAAAAAVESGGDALENEPANFPAHVPANAGERPPHFDNDGSLLRETPVRVIVRDAIGQLFVGVVPMRTTLYVWDTCLLASWFLLAPLAAAWLIALRRPLLEAETMAEALSELARASKSLTAEALQHIMEAHFMERLRESLFVPLRTDLDYLAFGEPHARAQRTTRYLDAFHAQAANQSVHPPAGNLAAGSGAQSAPVVNTARSAITAPSARSGTSKPDSDQRSARSSSRSGNTSRSGTYSRSSNSSGSGSASDSDSDSGEKTSEDSNISASESESDTS